MFRDELLDVNVRNKRGNCLDGKVHFFCHPILETMNKPSYTIWPVMINYEENCNDINIQVLTPNDL